ncbi:MAG: YjfB family protein [Geothrix sp.]|nr:YjfB family protein [Acidobacteriota bacterium]
MDVSPAGAIAQSQMLLQSGVAMGVLRKALDVQAQLGADLAKLLDQQAGVGQRVDTTA